MYHCHRSRVFIAIMTHHWMRTTNHYSGSLFRDTFFFSGEVHRQPALKCVLINRVLIYGAIVKRMGWDGRAVSRQKCCHLLVEMNFLGVTAQTLHFRKWGRK